MSQITAAESRATRERRFPLVPKLRLGTPSAKLCFPIFDRTSPIRVRSRRHWRSHFWSESGEIQEGFGMRWLMAGARAMLDMCSVYLSDLWEEFTRFRIQRESPRLTA